MDLEQRCQSCASNFEDSRDGGEIQRICSKMATGSGKTIVMAMLIAWHVLNNVAYKDSRFSKNILVVAPGLRVKSRRNYAAYTCLDTITCKL